MKRVFGFIARAIRFCVRPVYRAVKRLRLRNRGFSLITNNCCGGVMYHDLGQRFRSPTINLSIPPDEYIVFLEHLREALSVEPQDAGRSSRGYPIGELRLACFDLSLACVILRSRIGGLLFRLDHVSLV